MWRLLDRAAAPVSSLAFYVAVLLLVALMGIGTLDVIMTQLFHHAIPGAVELSDAALAVLTFLGLAQVQRDRGHIVIDLFTRGMTAAWARRMLIVSSIVELLFLAALGVAAWALTLRSVKLGETTVGYLSFPLYPGKALVFLGICLATLELARQALCLIAGRDPAAGRDAATGRGDAA